MLLKHASVPRHAQPFLWCEKLWQNLLCMWVTWEWRISKYMLYIILPLYLFIQHVQLKYKILMIIIGKFIKKCNLLHRQGQACWSFYVVQATSAKFGHMGNVKFDTQTEEGIRRHTIMGNKNVLIIIAQVYNKMQCTT